MTRARHHAAATVLVAAVLLAACGSSGNDGGGAGSTAATTGGGAATTAAGTPAAGGDAVTVKGFAFNPADLSVKTGTKVTWTNEDSTEHRIKSDDGSFNSDNLSQGATFDHTFDTAGTFAYICSIHPSMKGTITVTA